MILLIGARSFAAKDGPRLLSALVAAAAGSDVGACVQLDHCSDLDQIGAALDLGVGAVMADASKLDFEANVAFVRSAVERAAAFGAGVEAELGGITGDEDAARAVEAGALTDPDQAREFVQRSGVSLPCGVDRQRARPLPAAAAARLGSTRGDRITGLPAAGVARRVGDPGCHGAPVDRRRDPKD